MTGGTSNTASERSIRLAYLTAGAAGMYCGSCLHDNTLARALMKQGIDVQLIPLYTPIRTDEPDVSVGRVFFGGINVYLQEKLPAFRFLAPLTGRLLDQPWLLRLVASRAVKTSGSELGGLTVSMLRGDAPHQRKEVDRLCAWLERSGQPNLIVLSNALIAGCVPALKQRLQVPVLVTLQGDDVFLDELPADDRRAALNEIRRLADHVDGFLCHSRYYADYMAEYLAIGRDRIQLVPLGIDVDDFAAPPSGGHSSSDAAGGRPPATRPPTIGYLARLAPEKGLHLLVDAVVQLAEMPGMEHLRLEVAGWLGPQHQRWADEQFGRLRRAGLGDRVRYWGTVDRRQKLEMLRQLDVFSVPTTYRDPKGLFVLEALATGVPVVQPAHGAFPELLEKTGGGRLFTPGSSAELARQLHALLIDPQLRRELGESGRQAVRRQLAAPLMASETWRVLEPFTRARLAPPDASPPPRPLAESPRPGRR